MFAKTCKCGWRWQHLWRALVHILLSELLQVPLLVIFGQKVQVKLIVSHYRQGHIAFTVCTRRGYKLFQVLRAVDSSRQGGVLRPWLLVPVCTVAKDEFASFQVHALLTNLLTSYTSYTMFYIHALRDLPYMIDASSLHPLHAPT